MTPTDDDKAEWQGRAQCREQVYERDGHRCRCCQRLLSLHLFGPLPLAHMHEIVPRSRGGSIVDSSNVVMLCGYCHECLSMRVGGRTLILVPLTGAGANGGLKFDVVKKHDKKESGD